jgi:rhodanese-related sulfurtransferase
MQAGVQYVGVRGARLVLFDSDGVRAPVVASWLRQLGHDACVLRGGLDSGLDLAAAPQPQAPALAGITAQQVHERMGRGEVAVVDLRAGMKYRAGHIAGARWSIRPCLASDLAGETRQIVLVADEPGMAQWAALELRGAAPLLLEGGLAAWQQAGLPVEATPDSPTDAECIDYLFFVHDRHDGNKEAARRYLAWETGLVPQLDAQELAAFRLPEHALS